MWGLLEIVLSPQPQEVSDSEITNLSLKLGWSRLGPLLSMVAEGGEVGSPWEWLYQGEKSATRGMEQAALGTERHEELSWSGPGGIPLSVTWFGSLVCGHLASKSAW